MYAARQESESDGGVKLAVIMGDDLSQTYLENRERPWSLSQISPVCP